MDAPSRHTVMHAFDDHANTLGLEHVLDTVGDLRRHGLLYLQAPGERFYDPCQFADADHFPIGQITHMNFAYDRSHMVFAVRLETDVAQDDHLIVAIDLIERAPQILHRVFLVAAAPVLECLDDTPGSSLQALSVRVVSYPAQ